VKTDSIGRVIPQDIDDFTDNKIGIAMGLSQLGPYLSDDETVEFFKFMLSASLGDVKVEVRSSMLQAATATIISHKQVCFYYINCGNREVCSLFNKINSPLMVLLHILT